MFKKFLVIGAMVLTFVLGTSLSEAVPVPYLEIQLNDGAGHSLFILDGGAGDTFGTLGVPDGVVSFSGSLPGTTWTVNVTTAITYPTLGSTNLPQIDMNSVNASSSGAGSLWVSASATGFTLAPTPVTVQVGGTTAGNMGTALYFGASNTFFQTSNLLGVITFPSSPFSGTFSGTIPGGSTPYSLTLSTQINHFGNGATSFNADVGTVPEPATMLLLGSGLIGLGAYGRKKFLKK